MRYQLYIQGVGGRAWATLKQAVVVAKERFTVAQPNKSAKKVKALAVLRSDGAMQPVVVEGSGQHVLQTPEGPVSCVEVETGHYIIRTRRLPSGALQYIRRTGHVGIAPAKAKYASGKPKVGQWRVHPAELAVTTSFTRGKRTAQRKPPVVLAKDTKLVE